MGINTQIEVTDLHKSFGKNEVLKGITTKFEKGDVVCIIGPSGSGKSTFLRDLTLLIKIQILILFVKTLEWFSNISIFSQI